MYRGRQTLIWAYLLPIECFLSLFLLQPQANRSGGEARETGLPEWGSPRAGDFYPRPCTFRVNTVAQAFPASAVRPWPIPKSAHHIVCPGPSAAISYLLGSPPHMETLHVSPLVPKDHAKPQTPGYDIQVPEKPGLCCSPKPSTVHSTLPRMTAPSPISPFKFQF